MQYLTNKQHLFFWEFLHDTSINIVQKFAKERPYFRHYVIEFSKNLYQQIQSLPIDTAADKQFVIESLCIRNKHFPKISSLHFLLGFLEILLLKTIKLLYQRHHERKRKFGLHTILILDGLAGFLLNYNFLLFHTSSHTYNAPSFNRR